jgi:hypothetical protein
MFWIDSGYSAINDLIKALYLGVFLVLGISQVIGIRIVLETTEHLL